jgi:ABC-type Fe3+-hydroxamate transport system substrate-binding protein
MKIVSLVPSITELLSDLGLEREIKGITKFCIHPPDYQKSKIIVGGTKNLHLNKIRTIAPDLIIANKEENTKDQVEALQAEFNVYLTDVNSLDDALAMIRHTGKLTGREAAAESMIASITNAFTHLAEITRSTKRQKVAYLIWKDPFMVAAANTYINDMLQRCGFDNAFSGMNRYPKITLDELSAPEVDVILLSTEPYPFRQKHIDELSRVIQGKSILLADGEMFSWYGSRMLKAPAYFQAIVACV